MTRLSNPAPGRRISSPFGPRIDPISGKETVHHGLDFPGTFPVLAAADGVVITSAISARGLLGYYVVIEHEGRLRTVYAHGAHRSKMQVGQRVNAGDVVFTSGSTGYSTGDHLHFEVRAPDQFGRWVRVDPAPFLDDRPTPAEPRRRNSVTLYYCTTTDKPSSSSSPQPIQEYALAGDSPGTSANWIPIADPAVVQSMAAVHGSAVFLTRDSYAAFRSKYTEPLKVAGGSAVPFDPTSILSAIAEVPAKTRAEIIRD